ncbi:MAG: hypothetical protein ACREDR_33670, partial [Blastocatellia bacterium]
DICLVVRELTSYAALIHRVFQEHAVPLALEQRVELTQAPVIRAALKLFDILEDHARGPRGGVKAGTLADLIKTGYFRLPPSDLIELRIALKHQSEQGRSRKPSVKGGLSYHLRTIPYWNPDRLENAVAYVGEDLLADDWLIRARRIAEGTGYSISPVSQGAGIDGGSSNDGEQSSDLLPHDIPRRHAGSNPAITIEPEELVWASLVLERIWEAIRTIPRVASAADLRSSITILAERFGLAAETIRPINRPGSTSTLPGTALDFRGLKLLRLAIRSAAKAFDLVDGPSGKVYLADFLEEAVRALRSVVLPIAGADSGGVRALEVTDVRGLEFRAVFIAGLVEGGFPLRASRDWIYPQEQREALKSFGLTLEDLSPDTLLKEEHYFYQAACRAAERLYLTRPAASDDGNATIPSYYIDETRRAVAPEEIKAETVNRDFDGERLSDVSSALEAAVSLVRAGVRSGVDAGSGHLEPVLLSA